MQIERIESLKEEIKNKQEEMKEKQKELDSFDVSEHFEEDDFKEELNEETIGIAGCMYHVGDVLYKVDYTAFREGYNDWLDSKEKEEVTEYKYLEEQLKELDEELEDLEAELEDLEDN